MNKQEMTPAERSALVASVVASQRLAGVVVPRGLAARLLDEVLLEPLPAFLGTRRTIGARSRQRRAGTMGTFNPETWP